MKLNLKHKEGHILNIEKAEHKQVEKKILLEVKKRIKATKERYLYSSNIKGKEFSLVFAGKDHQKKFAKFCLIKELDESLFQVKKLG